MRRLLALSAAVVGGVAVAVVAARKLRSALACTLGLVSHDVERVQVTGRASGARCRRCGKAAASVLELLDPVGEDGHVRVARGDQQERLHGVPWF